jgi:hypothetical protein
MDLLPTHTDKETLIKETLIILGVDTHAYRARRGSPRRPR